MELVTDIKLVQILLGEELLKGSKVHILGRLSNGIVVSSISRVENDLTTYHSHDEKLIPIPIYRRRVPL